MNTQMTPVAQSPGLNLGDIYYILFRHKWKIILCALLGIGIAAAVRYFQNASYHSEAKLSVRYIASDPKGMGPGGENAKSPDQRGETIMNTETEILKSSDLALLVVQAIGAERILARISGGNSVNAAVLYLRENLMVRVAPGSTVINIVFKHPDPELVQPLLREVIDRYQKMHHEIHGADGMLGDHLSQQTDRLRSRLKETEEELQKVRSQAGVLSLEDAKKSYTEQVGSLRQQIFAVQADLALRTAVLEEMTKNDATSAPVASADAPIPSEIVDQYVNVSSRISMLQKREQEYLTQFQPENFRVRETQTQLAAAETTRKNLLAEHPRLVRTDTSSNRASQMEMYDATAAAVQIAALQSKLKVLTAQLDEVRVDIAKVDRLESAILGLNREKELQDARYRYFSSNLEQTRINESLRSGRVSNISHIQTPSAPFIDVKKTFKLMQMIALGGIAFGLSWAFAIEFFFDRSVRRPVDVERLVRYPLLLTIPLLKKKQLKLAEANRSAPNGATSTAIVPANNNHALDSFHETLRDRLIAYFESKNLTHKPKLVAVSSMGQQSGVTTTAAGLARTLSDTGEGNVLLVDMTGGQGSAQHFVKGKPACGLDEILDARDNAHVLDNLYVVGASENSDRLYRNLPQRFTKLVPKLKASDFDYIIFDMPPVSQISITPRLAGFMDMVLLVIESEKTDRDVVQRGAALLGESRAHVAVVLNKVKSYIPKRLQQEMLNS